MNDPITEKLEIEAAAGKRYAQVWEEYFLPFYSEKESDLFKAFKNTPSNDSEGLVAIRMQVNALEGLKKEFMSFIVTGNLANKSLRQR